MKCSAQEIQTATGISQAQTRTEARPQNNGPPAVQVYDLEKKGGSIIAGVLKLMQEKKKNPPPDRDARLPPKPAGQTVGSFREGLQMLPEAIAKNLQQQIRYGHVYSALQRPE